MVNSYNGTYKVIVIALPPLQVEGVVMDMPELVLVREFGLLGAVCGQLEPSLHLASYQLQVNETVRKPATMERSVRNFFKKTWHNGTLCQKLF